MTHRARFWLGGLTLPLCVGCIDTDAAVFVEASIADAAVSVEQSSLATGVAGGFSLSLHLGPRASGPSEVLFQSASITSPDRSVTYVDPLGVTSSPGFPFTVAPDTTANIAFTYVADDNLLEASAVDELCAGEVVVVAVLDDPLRGGSITPVSAPVAVTGCP